MASSGPDEVTRDDGDLRARFGFDLDADAWLTQVRRSTAPLGPVGRLGPYELVAEIGRGGQGIVYKARQPGTGREVALKRPAAGVFATPQMRARFEREIEAAAALDHPNIVTLYGTESIDDQPVLTMKWIDGAPFDTWARPPEQSRRDLPLLLSVFVTVCDAIQHAHQRGVIHRDIKPSNIFVDAANVPHVLDFGLAKLSVDAAAAATMTQTGDFIGTPAYAAPEQLRGDSRAIDVRTDVYALGAVLYQALTGRVPFEAKGPLARIIEQIQHADPPPPSRLAPPLDRELDLIVLKALAKAPNERYESVAALAADVRRYLAGQAIQAHPPSVWYRTRKFARQHWLPVAAGTVVVVTLIAATVVSTAALVEATRDRDRAGTALAAAQRERDRAETALSAEQTQRARAERETRKLASINRFVADILGQADPGAHGGRANVPIGEALAAASRRLIEGEQKLEPELEADLRALVGEISLRLDRPEDARVHYEAATALRRQVFGDHSEEVALSLNWLARAYRMLGRLDDAAAAQRESLDIRRDLLAPDDPFIAQALSSLAITLRHQGKYAEAEALYREALAVYEQRLNADNPNLGGTVTALAVLLLQQGRVDEAAPYAERAVDIFRKDGAISSNDLAGALGNLAAVRWFQKRPVDAEAEMRAAIALSLENYPDSNVAISSLQLTLARWLVDLGRAEEAEAPCRAALETRARLRGETDVATLEALGQLEIILRAQERYAEAASYASLTLARTEDQNPNSAQLPALRFRLASSLWRLGAFEQAAPLLELAYDAEEALGDCDAQYRVASELAELHAAWESRDTANGHAATAQRWRALAQP